MSKILLLAPVALGAILATTPASASLVELTNQQLTGQGLGSTLTALTLQSPGNSTTESGGVLFNGTPFGDAKTGASQSSTFTFGSLGITNANQLGLIVNLSEPGSENPPSVVTANSSLATNANLANTITLNVFSSSGTLLQSFSTAADQTLIQVTPGWGAPALSSG
jgi:hypothetical protein